MKSVKSFIATVILIGSSILILGIGAVIFYSNAGKNQTVEVTTIESPVVHRDWCLDHPEWVAESPNNKCGDSRTTLETYGKTLGKETYVQLKSERTLEEIGPVGHPFLSQVVKKIAVADAKLEYSHGKEK